MIGKVDGKIACGTGGASGIGRATAALLAREGATVLVTDLDVVKGAVVVGEITAAGGRARFLEHDVSREESWIDVIAAIGQEFGRLDILVNNAGIGLSGPIREMSLADWRRQTAVNLDGVFLGIKHGLSLMAGQGDGSIVNVSSISGIKASANAAGYCATKAAVGMLTKSAALECAAAQNGVRVNSIHPGVVETAIWDSLMDTTEDGANPRGPALEVLAATSIPLRRTGSCEEIAQGILWLASDDSSYVTGSALVIDGGRSIS